MTMKVASQPFTRTRVVLALLATTVLFACSAASASAVDVTLRIEGDGSNVFNGSVSTSAGSVKTTNDGGCADDATPPASISKATATTAVASWAAGAGVAYNTQYGGTYLCRVGSLIASDYNPDPSVLQKFWLMKINNHVKSSGGSYLTGSTELQPGDEVLFYWTDNTAEGAPTLAVDLPRAVQTGSTASGTVYKYNSNTDERTAAAGATVSMNGSSVTSGADGRFSLAFPTAGYQLVTATAAGAVRGSGRVAVTDAPIVPVVKKSAKERRAEARRKCLRTYKWHRKSSPRYKKCAAKANRIGKSGK
jgi:hypothetical protein